MSEVDLIQRRTVGVLAAGQVLGGVAVAGSIAAGSLLAASLAGSDAAAGLAQTFGVVGAAVMALPLARLALTRGRRAALSTGYGLGALGSALVILAAIHRNLPLLYLGCGFVGVATAAGFQARYAATDLALPNHRARALAWVVWAGTIGAIVGPNLLNASGILGLTLGLPQLSGPYVVAGVTLLLATLVLIIFLRPDPYLESMKRRRSQGDNSPRPQLRAGLAHLTQRPAAQLGIAVIAIGHVVMVMVMVMTPVHMAHVDVTLQLIGLVISVHVAGMYALSPLVGWAADRFGHRHVAGWGVVILAVSCVVAGFAPADNVLILGIGLFLLGLGWSFTLISGSAMVTDATHVSERPAVQGLSDLAMNVAGAIGGAAAGLIVWAFGYTVLCFLGLVPLIVLGIVLRRVAHNRTGVRGNLTDTTQAGPQSTAPKSR